MRKIQDEHCDIGAAQRGHLIQRVLVDGWTPAEAAQLIGVDKRQVRRWVADYRKHGMASLRAEPVEKLPRRWLSWMQARVARLRTMRRETGPTVAASCVILRSGTQRHRRF